jgi:hypothetical protein
MERGLRADGRLGRYDVDAKGRKDGQSKLEAELARLLDQDTVRWLLIEMAQNRNKALARQKVCTLSAALPDQAARKHLKSL